MLVNVMRWRDTTLACFRMRVFRGRCVLIVGDIRLGGKLVDEMRVWLVASPAFELHGAALGSALRLQSLWNRAQVLLC